MALVGVQELLDVLEVAVVLERNQVGGGHYFPDIDTVLLLQQGFTLQ